MRHRTELLVTALLVGISAYAGTASAAQGGDRGWYAGLDAGRSAYKADVGDDEGATAFTVRGGYRFNDWVAVETSYADLGSVDSRVDCPAGQACVPEAFPVDTSLSAQRADVAVLGILPITDSVEAFARVGVAYTEFDATVQQGSLGTDRGSDDSTDAIYGIGVRYNFDAPWALRLEYARTSGIGDTDVDLDTLTFGVEYRFGG